MVLSAVLGVALVAIHLVLLVRAARFALSHDFNMAWFSVATLAFWFVGGFVISWLRPQGYLGAGVGVAIGWLAVLLLLSSSDHLEPSLLAAPAAMVGLVVAGESVGYWVSVVSRRQASRGA
jgi:hypothetical protein